MLNTNQAYNTPRYVLCLLYLITSYEYNIVSRTFSVVLEPQPQKQKYSPNLTAVPAAAVLMNVAAPAAVVLKLPIFSYYHWLQIRNTGVIAFIINDNKL